MTEPDSPERAECEAEIARYFEALPAKVDNTAQFRLHVKAQIALAKEERKRIEAREAAFTGVLERLDGYITAVLEKMPEPKKGTSRKLEGRTNTLLLKGNGGDKPLRIQGWDSVNRQWIERECSLLPAEYRDVTLVMRMDQYSQWRNHLLVGLRLEIKEKDDVPNNARIRAVLGCGGSIPGAHLDERGKHIESR
jgi:hypothetical protein